MIERRLDNPHQGAAKRETDDHRYSKRESHLHNGPPQVFQMLQKRLGRFSLRRITEFEDVSQGHRITFVQTFGRFSLTPGIRQVKPAATSTGYFDSFGLSWKWLKRLAGRSEFRTRVKLRINENSTTVSHGGGAMDRRPREASLAQIPSVLASRISFSAIMRRISSLVNARQSRIDSPSSRSGPSAHG